MGAGVTAAVASAASYLDARYNIRHDLRVLARQRAAAQAVQRNAKSGRFCLWYQFEDQVKSRPVNEECIWSQNGCYTWSQTYDQSCRYGHYFHKKCRVQPRDLVALVLTNHAEFVFAWLGLWSIGCAPALINHHLTGDALIHCLKVSGAKVVVVDDDAEVLQRIEDIRPTLESMGLKVVVLDQITKSAISSESAHPPGNSLRFGMEPTFPTCLLYTR